MRTCHIQKSSARLRCISPMICPVNLHILRTIAFALLPRINGLWSSQLSGRSLSTLSLITSPAS